jgi:hypothetical protein
MSERKKLSDILRGTDRDALSKTWENTEAAKDLEPLPAGEYVFRILAGELFTSQRGTPGYKLSLEVAEGEHEGRRAWHEVYLTPAALPMAKRDLAKLGVSALEQLDRPLPQGILIRGRLALRTDGGSPHNRLVRFEAAGVEPSDAYEPKEDGDGKDGDEPGESFPFGANEPVRNGVAPTPYDREERR